MEDDKVRADLEKLLGSTEKAHRQAFAATNGLDPDWPRWYAEHMIDDFNRILGVTVGETQLAELLLEAEQEHVMTAPGREWPSYYAEFFIARLT